MNSSPELKIIGSFDLYVDTNVMMQHSKVKPYKWAAKVLYYEASRFFNFTLYDIKVDKHDILEKGIVRFYYEAKGINLTIAADR